MFENGWNATVYIGEHWTLYKSFDAQPTLKYVKKTNQFFYTNMSCDRLKGLSSLRVTNDFIVPDKMSVWWYEKHCAEMFAKMFLPWAGSENMAAICILYRAGRLSWKKTLVFKLLFGRASKRRIVQQWRILKEICKTIATKWDLTSL